ncbi:hypothetical protein VTO73DRAFT_11526 [Trametes versicolor]
MALLALPNQDILLEVFQHVGRQRQSSETHDDEPCHNDAETQTLARCARVCRAFREPSLRVLWEYLPSVLPLLQLLAPHFRKLEHGREGDKDWGEGHEYDTYVLTDTPNEDQWTRFREYAAYVRVLHETYNPGLSCYPNAYNDDEDPEPLGRIISSSVWFHLARLAGTEPMLPTLREVRWLMRGTDQVVLLDVLAGPCLRKLSAHFIPTHGVESSEEEYALTFPLLLRNIARLSPTLQELEISSCASLSGISGMPKLRILTILGVISADALRDARLDTLQELESLTIALTPPSETATHSLPLELLPLKTLALKYDCSSRSETRHYYVPLSASNLHSLRIDPGICSTTTGCRKLCAELVQRFPAAHSILLDLQRPSKGEARFQTPFEVLSALEPLFGISSVREFSLKCSADVMAFSVADMRAIAEAWPHLSTLSVDLGRWSVWGHQGSSLGVSALVDMARRGSGLRVLHLDHLRITLDDLKGYSGRRARTNPLPCSSSIEVLTVDHAETDCGQYSDSEGPRLSKCAMLVAKLFPNIDTKKSRTAARHPLREEPVWNKVLEHVDLVLPRKKIVL